MGTPLSIDGLRAEVGWGQLLVLTYLTHPKGESVVGQCGCVSRPESQSFHPETTNRADARKRSATSRAPRFPKAMMVLRVTKKAVPSNTIPSTRRTLA
jgi:hypothetical protein